MMNCKHDFLVKVYEKILVYQNDRIDAYQCQKCGEEFEIEFNPNEELQ